MFMFSDTPWLTWHELYAKWDPLPVNGPEYVEAEARAGRRLDVCVLGSKWACEEGDKIYSTATESVAGKLHVTPLGANWVPAMTREEIMARVSSRAMDEIELLYVGRDWSVRVGRWRWMWPGCCMRVGIRCGCMWWGAVRICR